MRESHTLTPTSSRSTAIGRPATRPVTKTTDGVHFGTYADGGTLGGSLLYKGANGLKLSDVNDYSFTFNYKQVRQPHGRERPYGSHLASTPSKAVDVERDGDRATDGTPTVILDPSLGGR